MGKNTLSENVGSLLSIRISTDSSFLQSSILSKQHYVKFPQSRFMLTKSNKANHFETDMS